MAKYHLSEDGNPRVCTAEEGNCPLGADEKHFSSKVGARMAYEASLKSEEIAPSLRKRGERPAYMENIEREPLETLVPEQEFEYVATTVAAGKLKVGDKFKEDGKLLIIRDIKKGTKNAGVKLEKEDGKLKNAVYRLDEPIDNVYVKTETEASKVAHRAAVLEQTMESGLKNYRPKQTQVLADMAMDAQRGYTRGVSSRVSNLIAAQSDDQVMAEYEHAVESVKTAIAEKREGFENETKPYTRAFNILKEDYTKEALRAGARGESNSTSEISNVVNRELIKAKIDFIDNWRWMY